LDNQTTTNNEQLNMKFTKYIVALAACIGTVAQAQLGFDAYSASRELVITAPVNINVVTAGPNGLYTNAAVDLSPFIGNVKIDITANTNIATATGTLTVSMYGSADATNWTAVANYAIQQTPYSQSITNMGFANSTNLIVTDSFLLPGTVTSPTAATAGFATPYLLPTPFTNTAAITLISSGTVTGNTIVGLRVKDQPRYLRLLYAATSGTVTNATVSATLTGLNY